MASRNNSKYARRRKNALLAVIVLALVLIVILIIIAANFFSGKKKPTASPTGTPVNSALATMPLPTPGGIGLATIKPDNSSLATLAPSATAPAAATATPGSTDAGKTMYCTGDSVRVRSTASTSGEVITLLSKGKAVTAFNKSGDWYYVKLSDGKTGYVSASFLSTTKPAVPTATPTPKTTPTPKPTTAPTSAAITSLTQIGLPVAVDKVLDVSRPTYNSYLKTYNRVEQHFVDNETGKYIYKMTGTGDASELWISYDKNASPKTAKVHSTYNEAKSALGIG